MAELRAGAQAAEELVGELAELTAGYGLYGFPAAQSMGARVAGVRNALADRALERNQALRMAVLDVQHVVTLCAYLAELGRAGGDEKMVEFCGRWERKLKRLESRVRKAAVAEGTDPDAAIVRARRRPDRPRGPPRGERRRRARRVVRPPRRRAPRRRLALLERGHREARRR